MFYLNYLDAYDYNLLFSYYEEDYLNSVNEDNFKSIYNLFCKYNFYFIKDIIVNYLEIFTMNVLIVEKKLIDLKNKLGEKFNYVIGQDMRYLNYIME